MASIGKAIKTRRHRQMTQGDLAALLGVTQPTVSDWENDKTRPSDEMLMRIEDALKLDRGQLLVDAGLVGYRGRARADSRDSFSIDERLASLPRAEQARAKALTSAILDTIEAELRGE